MQQGSPDSLQGAFWQEPSQDLKKKDLQRVLKDDSDKKAAGGNCNAPLEVSDGEESDDKLPPPMSPRDDKEANEPANPEGTNMLDDINDEEDIKVANQDENEPPATTMQDIESIKLADLKTYCKNTFKDNFVVSRFKRKTEIISWVKSKIEA